MRQAERVRVGCFSSSLRRLTPTYGPDPHPALRATFSHWEKDRKSHVRI